MKIMLDAGHYGKYNQSPVVKDYYESDFTWKFHLLLKKYLEAHGITVGTTRSAQANDLALEKRGGAAAGYDLFISLHSNAASAESVDYPLACCMIDDASTKIDDVSRELGERLANCVARIMGTKQDGKILCRVGANNKDYYGVLRGAKNVGVAGILLEHSFHTNAAAARWLLVDANLERLAAAEASLIAEYYNVKAATEEPVDTKEAFIQNIAAAAQKHKDAFGIKVVSPIVAQACLESAYGTSAKAKYHNYFGLKYRADRVTCNNGTFNAGSMEQHPDGSYTPTTADWYSFDSVDNGVLGYLQFLNVSRYENLKGVTDPQQYLENIKADGYATSIDYVKNLMNVIKSHNLTRFDTEAAQQPSSAATAKYPYLVVINTDYLNVRGGPGVNYLVNTAVKRSQVYTIVDSVLNGTTEWGKLKSGAGWISLKYTKRKE